MPYADDLHQRLATRRIYITYEREAVALEIYTSKCAVPPRSERCGEVGCAWDLPVSLNMKIENILQTCYAGGCAIQSHLRVGAALLTVVGDVDHNPRVDSPGREGISVEPVRRDRDPFSGDLPVESSTPRGSQLRANPSRLMKRSAVIKILCMAIRAPNC